ncbi:VOC family protein [Nocardia tengchongensis]
MSALGADRDHCRGVRLGGKYRRLVNAGVEFVTEPRTEPYGQVAVFLDIAGNRWDLLGPPAPAAV